MFALQSRRAIQEVALAVTVSWLPLILGTPHHLAYGVFAILFIARFALQPPPDAPLTLRRRALLIVVTWTAFAALAWAWLPLFHRRPA